MALFKVGQRVRLLPTDRNPWTDEGTIVAFDPNGGQNCPAAVWVVRADNHPSGWNKWCPDCWWSEPHTIAPLTDPKADEFVRRVTEPRPALCQGDVGEHQRTPYKWPAKV